MLTKMWVTLHGHVSELTNVLELEDNQELVEYEEGELTNKD